MSTILEKISAIESEVCNNLFFSHICIYGREKLTYLSIPKMARTQKNKATSAHLGLLKAKLAKLRRELISPKGGGGGAGEQGMLVKNVSDVSNKLFMDDLYLAILRFRGS